MRGKLPTRQSRAHWDSESLLAAGPSLPLGYAPARQGRGLISPLGLRKEGTMKAILFAGALALTTAVVANAAPVTYKIDPDHTYPSFSADHMGGLSILRGTFKSTDGSITLDKAAKSGTVDITIDTTSLSFNNDKLSEHAKK